MPGESIGMSLTTLAELLIELGAVEGMNLDGGGSTTMVVKNKLVNRPSDATGERPVSDAILVFPRAN
jgi:exopolysaccharide biosynthesis protein